MTIGTRHLKVKDRIATTNATAKRPVHSAGAMRTNPGETSLGEQSPGKQIPGKNNLGGTSFPMTFAKTVAGAKKAGASPVVIRARIDSRTCTSTKMLTIAEATATLLDWLQNVSRGSRGKAFPRKRQIAIQAVGRATMTARAKTLNVRISTTKRIVRGVAGR
jgi:hypothetical protein